MFTSNCLWSFVSFLQFMREFDCVYIMSTRLGHWFLGTKFKHSRKYRAAGQRRKRPHIEMLLSFICGLQPTDISRHWITSLVMLSTPALPLSSVLFAPGAFFCVQSSIAVNETHDELGVRLHDWFDQSKHWLVLAIKLSLCVWSPCPAALPPPLEAKRQILDKILHFPMCREPKINISLSNMLLVSVDSDWARH